MLKRRFRRVERVDAGVCRAGGEGCGCEARGSGERPNRLSLFLMAAGLLSLFYWCLPGEAGAAPWSIVEIPVATAPGDQLSPSVSGTTVVYNDLNHQPGGNIVMKDIHNPAVENYLYGPGIWAGPVIDGGLLAWQNTASEVCLRSLAGGEDTCVVSTAAADMALSGNLAVTGEADGGSTISRINFDTRRSKKIDSHELPGMRYDPDIEGTQAVWVRLRGYGTQYYEPLVVSYDVSDDTWVYLTGIGGGVSSSGDSLYERRQPSLDNGRVLYQQRLNEPGETWDIYEAVPDTFGVPVFMEQGDQVKPSLDGNTVVFQDNRSGQVDGNGEWTGEWDLYIRDLDTGAEQPLSLAPGNQVNPEIHGNVIVWEDDRNGDWDVYAAVLSPVPGPPPAAPVLSLAIGPVYWGSYADYQVRELTADYSIANSGGAALAVTVQKVDTVPATVTVAGNLPAPLAELGSGQTGALSIRYSIPVSVGAFRTSLYASCDDAAGNNHWFPGSPPAST